MVDKASIVLSSRDIVGNSALANCLNYLFWVAHDKSPCSNVNRLFTTNKKNTHNQRTLQNCRLDNTNICCQCAHRVWSRQV